MEPKANPPQVYKDITRREFGLEIAGVAALTSGLLASTAFVEGQTRDTQTGKVLCAITINGHRHELSLDPRVTLLDLLRERLHFYGTKKGCDHGQCGACTVLVNRFRVNSCLSLAVSHDGDDVTTIEGLSGGEGLHPMQAAFIEHDGFQCGYCTPGQICSSVAMLEEARAGVPSAVTPDISKLGPIQLAEDEIRERMSGNICRCGAYPNIVAAVRSVYEGRLG